MSVYLDHAACTTIRPSVEDFFAQENLKENLKGNASSVHKNGRIIREILDEARQDLKSIFECEIDEIIFTSGATESLNLAIIGGYLGIKNPQKNIFVSPLTHSAVRNSLKFLEKFFEVKINFLPIDQNGFLNLNLIDDEILENSDLIITEFGNSEIGLIQPIIKLGRKIEDFKNKNKKIVQPLFVVDGAASFGSVDPVGLNFQKADFLTLSGEKFGGLAGSGVLLKKENINLEILQKGTQEWGNRGGTENILGIKSLSLALKECSEKKVLEIKNYEIFQKICRNFFEENFSDIKIITPKENYLPHVFTFLLPESFLGNVFVVQADLQGLSLSSGSACSSGTVGGSKVLQHLGYSQKESERVIRLSFGWDTTEKEVKNGLDIIGGILG